MTVTRNSSGNSQVSDRSCEAVATLTRPGVKNATNAEMWAELADRNVGPTRTADSGYDFIVTYSDGTVFRIPDNNKYPVEALAAIHDGETVTVRRLRRGENCAHTFALRPCLTRHPEQVSA